MTVIVKGERGTRVRGNELRMAEVGRLLGFEMANSLPWQDKQCSSYENITRKDNVCHGGIIEQLAMQCAHFNKEAD
jgi:hypothetical protein